MTKVSLRKQQENRKQHTHVNLAKRVNQSEIQDNLSGELEHQNST